MRCTCGGGARPGMTFVVSMCALSKLSGMIGHHAYAAAASCPASCRIWRIRSRTKPLHGIP
eukprot:3862119-Karenia_brevis.AAC.1